MEDIRLTQTHAFSSTSSVASGSSESLALTSARIDEMLISDEVLGVC